MAPMRKTVVGITITSLFVVSSFIYLDHLWYAEIVMLILMLLPRTSLFTLRVFLRLL